MPPDVPGGVRPPDEAADRALSTLSTPPRARLASLGLNLRPMRPREHQELLEADMEVYASSMSPVTLATLRGWCEQVPEMAFVIEDRDESLDEEEEEKGEKEEQGVEGGGGGAAEARGRAVSVSPSSSLRRRRWRQLGCCAVTPCNARSFAALTSGVLREGDMYGGHVYDVRTDDELGLHFYHMHRRSDYPRRLPDFGLLGLYGVAHAVHAAQARREALGRGTPLTVCGMSGLAASPSGVSMTTVLYGSRERSYICPEHVLRAPPARGDGAGGGGRRRLEVHELRSQEELEALLAAGYQLVVRCRMLVLLPDEPSLLWTVVPRRLPGGGGGPAGAAGPSVSRPTAAAVSGGGGGGGEAHGGGEGRLARSRL